MSERMQNQVAIGFTMSHGSAKYIELQALQSMIAKKNFNKTTTKAAGPFINNG